MNNDMSGTRAEFGAGVSAQATKNLQFYADLRYAKGSKIEMPWAGGVGMRWTW
ncbi:autotransporter outer membrane beta-barrel domain-containing protein [Achromobacter sp. UMC46]|uniref:autotransporter outer membrane beta-barrel domain-containing protein n=1 Tax=Achromobacter sp. UMC46 TaxID=1862319 RepID=UPI00351C1F50